MVSFSQQQEPTKGKTMTAKTFTSQNRTDDRGVYLVEGDRVLRTAVDHGAPLWASRGTVVGFGTKRIEVRWDGNNYGTSRGHMTNGHVLRKITECDEMRELPSGRVVHCNTVLHPEGGCRYAEHHHTPEPSPLQPGEYVREIATGRIGVVHNPLPDYALTKRVNVTFLTVTERAGGFIFAGATGAIVRRSEVERVSFEAAP